MQKRKKEVNDFERSSKQYCKEISDFKSLSKEEEIALIKDYKRNHNLESRDKLINANLKFVMNIARNYAGRGLSYSDLISEGNIGLMKAIERFDENKDCKAITYSVFWIKQTIREAINKRNGIEHEDFPDDSEYQQISDDDDTQVIIGDEFYSNNIDSDTNKNDLKKSIEIIMSSLTNKEKEVIELYYGLLGDEPMTLDEIGTKIGLTKERIRQIKLKANKKMKSAALLNSITSDIYI